jgi:DNA-binding phage protein
MKLLRSSGVLGHLADSVKQSSFRLGRAVAPNKEPRQADVIRVVKSGGIQLALFKRPQNRIVAHGGGSEVEFHRGPR